jgi:hypothetical protein
VNCPPWLWKVILNRLWPPEFLRLHDAQGLARITKDFPLLPTSKDAPVFILSAGWRSGSTLLQRCINSNPKVMVWGEAYEDYFLHYHMLAPIMSFTKDPLNLQFLQKDMAKSPDHLASILTTKWIANLSPSIASLKMAHLAYMTTLFKIPASDIGRPRWGLKMVRGSMVVAAYLKWLYPHAKILYLYRDPYSAFLSYKNNAKSPWYLYYPSHPVNGVIPFAVHWRHCVEGYMASQKELNAFIVRYESLVDRQICRQLQEYLEFDLDYSILDVKADMNLGQDGRNNHRLTYTEKKLIEFIAGDVALKCGYAAPRV